jgi:hypothetical protein
MKGGGSLPLKSTNHVVSTNLVSSCLGGGIDDVIDRSKI